MPEKKKELPILEAPRKIGTGIPSTTTTKNRDQAVPISGVLAQCPPTLSLSVVPPYSMGECFVSLWGPGYQREFQGNIRVYPPDKEVEESLMHVVAQHAIWRVMPRSNEAASTWSQWAPDDREEDWNLARKEVEVAIHHKLYQRNDQRNVPDIGWIKSTAWKLKKKRQQCTKTGGYVPVSELISVPPRDWVVSSPSQRITLCGGFLQLAYFRRSCGVEGTKLPWNRSSVRGLLDWILVASALGDEWYNYTLQELQH